MIENKCRTILSLARGSHKTRNALDTAADARRQVQRFPVVFPRPHDFGRLRRLLKLIAGRAKTPDQIVVKMVRFVLSGRNTMDVDARQKRRKTQVKLDAGLFLSFTRRHPVKRYIGLFHMPARQQPSLETVVMNDEDTLILRMEDERRARDMSWPKLPRRERLGAMPQKQAYQVLALGRKAVVARIEGRDQAYRFLP
jgi:hypothetical protein